MPEISIQKQCGSLTDLVDTESFIEGFSMMLKLFRIRALLVFAAAVALVACATGPQITRTLDVPESADMPYRNILVIALAASFDVRKKFEKQVVSQLTEYGTTAVASTSLMNTSTPVTRETFFAMVETLDADAVLITQVVSLESDLSMKDRSPEATYKFRPTYYYNVWEVELTEYIEPPGMELKSSLVLATQLHSVLTREAVWAIESKSKIVHDVSRVGYYPFFVDEAKAIASYLSKDGLIARQSGL
ncbi:MAG: hypothetical protein E2O52_02765 [Gammaproteobacteria bacterium]|nr:MAG: hypothetical protein E2O52_02765 [Gammaproteobacteria bacterium]